MKAKGQIGFLKFSLPSIPSNPLRRPQSMRSGTIIMMMPGDLAVVGPAFRIVHAQRKQGPHGRVAAAAPVIAHIVLLALLFGSAPAANCSAMPMQPVYRDGVIYRHVHKKVLNTRLHDEMENFTHGSFQGVGSITLSIAEARQCRHFLASHPPTRPNRRQATGST